MKLQVPHTLVLLFIMMVAALIATYLLPSGSFESELVHGKDKVIPGTYHQIDEKQYLAPWTLLTAIPRALADSQGIIFFVLIIGGALAVIKHTGVIDAVLGKMLNRYGKKPNILILTGMLVFGIGSSTLGMAEEYLPFVSVLIVLCRALKMDVITAVGIMVVGYGIGYGTAAVNPFTVVIAQEIAEVPPTSGIWYRLVLFVPFFAVGFWHVRSYAQQIQLTPAMGFYTYEETHSLVQSEYPQLSKLHILILTLTIAAIALIVYGISSVSEWGWYLTELSAVFLGLTLVVILVARINVNKAAGKFVEGATELISTALLIGFARAIALILEEGQVLHTIVHGLSIPLQQVGPHLSAVGMYIIQSTINFFIPSGSGQAFVTMPLMAPIGDITGVGRQVSVLAYQFGDGFTNMLVPTNAVLMGILGIAGIPYDKWFKFIMPLMIKFWLLGTIALVVAVLIQYQ